MVVPSRERHPIWGLMKTLLIAGCCALYLSFNAQNWDSGETRTVILTWLTSVIFEGVNVGRKA